MKRDQRGVRGVLLLVLFASCAAPLKAARAPDGSPLTLAIYFDRSAVSAKPDQVNQLIGFMEPDLHSQLLAAGYQLEQTNNPETFLPGPNRYLLIVRIVSYDAGSRAARMWAGGFGAGAATLQTQHVLFAGPEQLLLQGTGSEGSTRDWNFTAMKINQQISRDVTVALSPK
jgi:hypothetical protein